MDKALKDLKAALCIIDDSIDLFRQGRKYSYRVIAAELRLILCDTKPLIYKIFKNSAFHPLRGLLANETIPNSQKKGLVLQIPSLISFDGIGNSRILSLFDEKRDPISIEEWLDQPLFNEYITIRKLIRSVADKEAVHSDKKYDDILLFTKSVKIIDEDLHEQYIVAIGEYVSKSLILILSSLIP